MVRRLQLRLAMAAMALGATAGCGGGAGEESSVPLAITGSMTSSSSSTSTSIIAAPPTTTTIAAPTTDSGRVIDDLVGFLPEGEFANYLWKGEPAPLGILLEDVIDSSGREQLLVSGELAGRYARDYTASFDADTRARLDEVFGAVEDGSGPGYFVILEFNLGDNPTTGETIYQEFIMGQFSESAQWNSHDIWRCWVPEDPIAPREARDINESGIRLIAWLTRLEVGRRYPFFVAVDSLSVYVPKNPEEEEFISDFEASRTILVENLIRSLKGQGPLVEVPSPRPAYLEMSDLYVLSDSCYVE